ncbi:pyruvate synthase alpha chain [Geobacillus stearothermophilus]
MKGWGEHETKLIPADGEHGSAGICYGASLMGASALFFLRLSVGGVI